MKQRVLRKPLPLKPKNGKAAAPSQAAPPSPAVDQNNSGEIEKQAISSILETNIQSLQQVFGDSSDVVYRHFQVGKQHHRAAAVYVEGLVNTDTISNHILQAAMLDATATEAQLQSGDELTATLALLRARVLSVGEAKEVKLLDEVIPSLLAGDTALFFEDYPGALLLSTKGWQQRALDEPPTEPLIRGPRDGFTETLRTNTALLRRHLRDPRLRLEARKVGRRSATDLVIAFIDGIVNPKLVQEVKRRLATIDIDQVPESGYLEQLIEDSPFSPLPQVQYSERPDKVVAALLEGRVALLLDGTPFVLIAPATFPMFFQSPEDYYDRWILASFTRMLRIAASYLATFTPALYVALVSINPGLIPESLALSIATAREGVPFPAVLEALIMEISFELFREAGARLPRSIGQTVGVVGGLIVGQAAVNAKLVSSTMLIVVALTSIASFAIPSYNMASSLRLLRFPLLLLAAVLGLYGVVLGFIVINIHMVTLKSFGKVYLAPLAPYRYRDMKDSILRAPLRALLTRPLVTGALNKTRQRNRKKEGW